LAELENRNREEKVLANSSSPKWPHSQHVGTENIAHVASGQLLLRCSGSQNKCSVARFKKGPCQFRSKSFPPFAIGVAVVQMTACHRARCRFISQSAVVAGKHMCKPVCSKRRHLCSIGVSSAIRVTVACSTSRSFRTQPKLQGFQAQKRLCSTGDLSSCCSLSQARGK
jgi:hypothetical protein